LCRPGAIVSGTTKSTKDPVQERALIVVDARVIVPCFPRFSPHTLTDWEP
jgi:hypothetical protein